MRYLKHDIADTLFYSAAQQANYIYIIFITLDKNY